MEADLLTTLEAARLAGLGSHVLRSAIRRKRLATQRSEHHSPDTRTRIWIARADLQAWLELRKERQQQQPRPAGGIPFCRHSEEWARLLTESRQEQRLTKQEVARRAQVSPGYVTRMEQGLVPKRSNTIALAKALGINVDRCLLLCGYSPDNAVSPLLIQTLTSLNPEEQGLLAKTLICMASNKERRRSFLLLLHEASSGSDGIFGSD